MHTFFVIYSISLFIYGAYSKDCQSNTFVAGNYSWPDDTGVPQQFKPADNQTCRWNMTIPSGSYVKLTVDGKFDTSDSLTITDSNFGAPYTEQLYGNGPESFYLTAGISVFDLNCLLGSTFTSTISIQIKYYKLPDVAPKSYQIAKSSPFLLTGNDLYNQPITLKGYDTGKTILISGATPRSDLLSLAPILLYEGNSMLGVPLGSLFLNSQIDLFPFYTLSDTVTIVNLDNSSPTVVLALNKENLDGFATYLFRWYNSSSSWWSQPLSSTRNGKAAMTSYRPNGDSEYLGTFGFDNTNRATMVSLLDGPPLAGINNTLASFAGDSSIANQIPIQMNGVLNTYVVQNATALFTLVYDKRTFDDMFTMPRIGRRGFLASQDLYLTNGRNKSITFVDGSKSRFNFALTYVSTHFDKNSPGGIFTVTIMDIDQGGNTFIKQVNNVTIDAKIVTPFVNQTGYSMTIDYIQSPSRNSDFYFQFAIDMANDYNPTVSQLQTTTTKSAMTIRHFNILNIIVFMLSFIFSIL